jgi:hypothetical protein
MYPASFPSSYRTGDRLINVNFLGRSERAVGLRAHPHACSSSEARRTGQGPSSCWGYPTRELSGPAPDRRWMWYSRRGSHSPDRGNNSRPLKNADL